ncbi:MAG: tetratricopeptide repeat protein [Aequorivita sp.]
MKKHKTYQIALITLFCCFTTVVFSQKDLDSTINKAYIKVFENPSEVIESGKIIFEKATSPETKSKALMLVSAAYLSKRENEKSLQYSLKAQQYIKEISDTKSKMDIFNAMGMQYQQLHIYDKAIEYLDEALRLAEKSSNKDSLFGIMGYNYAIRGFIYREQMSCEIALNYLDKAIAQYKKKLANKTMNANLSILTYNKGNCLLQISQIDSARANFQKSIEYAQAISANSLFAFAKKGLSEVFTAEGKYEQAIQELKEAEKASVSVGDLILNHSIYKNFSDNYLALGDRELYKTYFRKYLNVQKQINEKEQKTINNSINNLIDDIKIKTNNELSKLRKIQWTFLLFSIIILFIVGSLAFKNRNKYRKAKVRLETMKQKSQFKS